MNRKVLGALVVLVLAGAQLCQGEQVYGEIAGNVPTIAYDNAARVYTQIVVPPGSQNDPLSQTVVNAFATDPTVRNNSIVRINAADSNFQYRWGNSFYEASAGYPTVAVIKETAGAFTPVWKMPMTSAADVQRELPRCTQALLSVDLNCPNCPKPFQPAKPNQPTLPSQPAAPNLPPLPNTPGTPSSDDDPALMVLAIAGGLFAGWIVMFKRGL